MLAKKNRVRDECAYCSGTNSLTKDHIPPKNLFPKPRPNNLITVPCCIACNHKFSMDDEYFRMIISTRKAVSDHHGALQLRSAIQRSLSRPQKVDLSNQIFASPHAGNRAIDIDVKRINKVIIRITTGLFFHEEGYSLPGSYKISIYSNPFSDYNKFTYGKNIEASIKEHKVFGQEIFSYGRLSLNEESSTTFWSLLFFGKINFISTSYSIEKLRVTPANL